MVKFIGVRSLSILFFAMILVHFTAWNARALRPESQLPEFVLQMPSTPEVAKYLGLKDTMDFSIYEIPAKLTIVEFFSVTCPVCHKQAPRANRIFNFIERDKQLSKDIKMIAVGLGNKPNELSVYSSKFGVAFPLFADPQKRIQEETKVKKLPLTVLVDKNGKVLSSHLGIVKDLDSFFRELKDYHKQQ